MGFENILNKFLDFDWDGFFNHVTESNILQALRRDKLTWQDYLALLSPKAESYLEEMAERARQITIQNFGKTIQLYIPLYISDYCTNECAYCGFNRKNDIERNKLTLEEIEKNAKAIAQTKIKHILVLTGESRAESPPSYIMQAVEILKRTFDSVSLEVYPMEEAEYREFKLIGVDGLTVYQETYDREVYQRVHLSGRKTDYLYRLQTPERAAQAGIRTISIGALMGLANPLTEGFYVGLHAKYLQDHYLESEISVSIPRINPAVGHFDRIIPLSDKKMVQLILALRLFLPKVGINLSTRENAQFRDRLIPLGITKMSAGSASSVGGYLNPSHTPQFEISDNRSVVEVAKRIIDLGYEPVYKDWLPL